MRRGITYIREELKEAALNEPLRDAVPGRQGVRGCTRRLVVVAVAFGVRSFEQHLYIEIVSSGDPAGPIHRITLVIFFTEYLYEVCELRRHPDDGLHLGRIQNVGVRVQEIEGSDVHSARRVCGAHDTMPKRVAFAVPVADGVLSRVSSAHRRVTETTLADRVTAAPQLLHAMLPLLG